MYEVITADQIEPGMVISFLNTQANSVFLLYPTAVGASKTYHTPVLSVNTYGKPSIHPETQVVVVEGTFYFSDDAVLVQTGEISQDEVYSLIKQRTERLAREYS